MTHPVILAAKRTPVGRFLGGLSRVPSPQLGAFAIEAVLDELPAARDHIDECIMGCVLQAGLGQNPARQALADFKEIQPRVFAGMFPINSDDYNNCREALKKLKLNDAALHFEPETSQ